MTETCRLTTPFGEVLLEIGISGEPSVTTEVKYGAMIPDLPDGMRVDECRQASCTITPLPRGIVAFRMTCALLHGCVAGTASGQDLCAFDVDGPQLRGAFGMQDDDWFRQQPGVEVTECNYDPDGRCALRLQTTGDWSLTIGLAAAWQLNPDPHQIDYDGPWFAVDRALPLMNRKRKWLKS